MTDEFEHALVGHPSGDARHQAVMIDSIEKFFEVKINDDVVALGYVSFFKLFPRRDTQSGMLGRAQNITESTCPTLVAIFASSRSLEGVSSLAGRLLRLDQRRRIRDRKPGSIRGR